METINDYARVGRRAAFQTLPLGLLFAAGLTALLLGPEGLLVMAGFGLLGLPGLLPAAWLLGGWGGTRVLQDGGDATVTGFLVSGGSLLTASFLGSGIYAIVHVLRVTDWYAKEVANQFLGPLYFIMVFGLPVCVILGLVMGWFLRRAVSVQRAPFRPLRAILLATVVFPGAPGLAVLLLEVTRGV